MIALKINTFEVVRRPAKHRHERRIGIFCEIYRPLRHRVSCSEIEFLRSNLRTTNLTCEKHERQIEST